MKPAPSLVPRWHEDLLDAERERRSDGDAWTEETRPGPLLETRRPIEHQPKARRARQAWEPIPPVVIAGYIFAALLPALGFILGLTQINRNKHGRNIMVLSIVLFIIW
jgi:hypothetical protein